MKEGTVAPGGTFGRYRVEARLGRGGMGEVFRAKDTLLGREVALKTLLADGADDGRARMLREARAAAALRHPNAVHVYDVGEHDGIPFLTMELIDGAPLRVRAPGASIRAIVRWLGETAAALAAAHDLGLVHRDVKPDNVMIRNDGHAVVLDFGIARRQSASEVDASAPTTTGDLLATLTGKGVFVGTPAYMAPEQLHGAPADGRSDQFSWGVMAYEVLTGALPWGHLTDAVALVAAIAAKTPEPLPDTVPPRLAEIVHRSLDKDPAKRFATMHEIVTALSEPALAGDDAIVTPGRNVALAGPLASAPTELATPVPRPRGRGRWLAALVLGVVAATAGTFAFRATREAPTASAAPAPSASSSPRAGFHEVHCSVPAADAALDEGRRLFRTRSNTLAVTSWQEALRLDPTCAAALVRITVSFTWYPFPEQPGRFHAANAVRDRLDDHDRAIVDSLAPLYAPKMDPDEARRRIAAARVLFPSSIELAFLATSLAADAAARQKAIDELVALDPRFLPGLAGRTQVAMLRRDPTALVESAEACRPIAPTAPMCLNPLVEVLNFAERCAELADVAQALRDAAPDHPGGPIWLARVRAAQGADPSAVDALIAQARGRAAAPVIETEILVCHALVIRGGFDLADGCFRDLATQCHDDADCRFQVGSLRALLLRESGRDAAALDVAEEVARHASAWSTRRVGDVDVLDATWSHLLRKAAGRFTGDPWESARRVWATQIEHPTDRWVAVYGGNVYFDRDAKVAVENLPTPLDTTWMGRFQYAPWLGVALFHAGRLDEAAPVLEHVDRGCDGLQDPIARTRSLVVLGQLREKRGDVAGARAAYEKVLARWGTARPRSITADEARKRLAALPSR